MSDYWPSFLSWLDLGLGTLIEALGGGLWWTALIALLVPVAIAFIGRSMPHAAAALVLSVLALYLVRLDDTASGLLLYGASLATGLLAIGTGNARRHRAALTAELATARRENQVFLTALDQRSKSLDAALAKINAARKDPARVKETPKDASTPEKRTA